jgi:hypothetical protein
VRVMSCGLQIVRILNGGFRNMEKGPRIKAQGIRPRILSFLMFCPAP